MMLFIIFTVNIKQPTNEKTSDELVTRSVGASAITEVLWGHDCGKLSPVEFVPYRGLCARLVACCLATATVRVEIAHLRMEVAKF